MSKNYNMRIDTKHLEYVEKFKYLGRQNQIKITSTNKLRVD